MLGNLRDNGIKIKIYNLSNIQKCTTCSFCIKYLEYYYCINVFQLNLHKGCVYSYMKYAEAKLREEEQRALKYLETNVAAIITTG